MATIVIYTSGTLGDHLPFIALGQALKARGHTVRMAINRAMLAYAQRAGLETFALSDIERGPEEAQQNAWAWDHWNNPDPGEHPQAKPLETEEFIGQVRELAGLCREADLFISTSIRVQGYLAASATGLPWMTVSMNPFAFWQPADEQERSGWLQGRVEEYNQYKDLIQVTYAGLGVKKTTPAFSAGWSLARHVLLASSPHFSLPDLDQLQPTSSIDMTGFWFYQDPAWENWQPDEALRRFCEPDAAERKPIALTFSSQPLEDPRSLLGLHVKAAAQLGRPLVVQRGWAGFSEADLPPEAGPDQVLFADYLPHDWLFARSACAIQHGGIGSIARALRQGCPLVIEPFGNDQIYNASRVIDLGVGVAMHPFQSTVDGLVQALEEIILTTGYRQRAEALGARLNTENGLETACMMVEKYLARLGPDGQHPPIYERLAMPLTPRRQQAPEHGSAKEKVPLIEIKRERISLPPPIGKSLVATSQGQEASEIYLGKGSIPRIIHQTWKDASPPPEFVQLQHTWREYHPDWTIYLWTDVDNRELLRRHYAWFLPIYDSYPEQIMRADAARYFILHHFGGVYIDLDFECLRGMEPLLEGRQVLFGLEPEAHLRSTVSQSARLTQIIGNAWMASVPGHPFWEHVFKQLVAYHLAASPLDVAGPYLLTRAYQSFPHPEALGLARSDLLYPIDNEQRWSEINPDEQRRIRQTAYAIHHWKGSWWSEPAVTQERLVKVSLLLREETVAASLVKLDRYLELLHQKTDLPLISCLMVTSAKRSRLARRAVQCFMGQTYSNKELVILDDSLDKSLEGWIESNYPAALSDHQIAYVRCLEGKTEPVKKTLGELRNLAVEHARGAYIAQWDDDDLSDRQRLEIQMAAIHALGAQACLLERHQIWWPEMRRLAFSTRRAWESSFVCEKSSLPAYPAKRRGEDTPVISQILAHSRVVLLDLPRLYTYIFHGDNTFGAEHWEAHWRAASQTFEGEPYEVKLREMEKGLSIGPLAEQAALEQPPARNRAGIGEEDVCVPGTATVLILTPVKDAADFLPRYLENLMALSYPHERISLAFLESDSSDGSYAFLERSLPGLQAEFARVSLFKRDFNFHLERPRWEMSQQLRRRSTISKSRNFLLARALQAEDWVLWIDADVSSWPPDVIEKLLEAGKEIVVPNCLGEGSQESFDLNTFKLKPGAEGIDWSPYVEDGLLQPPKGFGRLYLSDLQDSDCIEVEAVGGAMLLVRADLHREGLVFPPFPYKLFIDTEGLSQMARDMGYRCWGLPNLQIYHPLR